MPYIMSELWKKKKYHKPLNNIEWGLDLFDKLFWSHDILSLYTGIMLINTLHSYKAHCNTCY